MFPVYTPFRPLRYSGSPYNTPHKLQGSLLKVPPKAPREAVEVKENKIPEKPCTGLSLLRALWVLGLDVDPPRELKEYALNHMRDPYII